MLTELTFAILKYGFLVLLWIFVACTVRSLYRDVETLSPRKSRAHAVRSVARARRRTPRARGRPRHQSSAPHQAPNPPCWSSSMAPLPAVPSLWPATPSHLAVPLRTPWCWMMNSFPPTMRALHRSRHRPLGHRGSGIHQRHRRQSSASERADDSCARVPVRIGATTFELR